MLWRGYRSHFLRATPTTPRRPVPNRSRLPGSDAGAPGRVKVLFTIPPSIGVGVFTPAPGKTVSTPPIVLLTVLPP